MPYRNVLRVEIFNHVAYFGSYLLFFTNVSNLKSGRSLPVLEMENEVGATKVIYTIIPNLGAKKVFLL
jgi:hypothetical protein